MTPMAGRPLIHPERSVGVPQNEVTTVVYACTAPASIKLSIRLDAGLLPSSLLRDQPLEVELSHRRLLILRCSSLLVR